MDTSRIVPRLLLFRRSQRSILQHPPLATSPDRQAVWGGCSQLGFEKISRAPPVWKGDKRDHPNV